MVPQDQGWEWRLAPYQAALQRPSDRYKVVIEGADHGLGKSVLTFRHPGNPFWAYLGGLHSLIFFEAYVNGQDWAKQVLQQANAIDTVTQYEWKTV